MTSKTSSSGTPTAPWRRLLIPALATLAGLVVLLNLGFWQVERLAWKDELIEKVAADVTKPAEPAPTPSQWPAGDATAYDYRHVAVEGHFREGAVYYYTALGKSKGAYDGPGFMVYAPFETSAGWTVLVNRGFIPEGLSAADRQTVIRPPEGPQSLSGLLRVSEQPNWTTPAADPQTRIWFARDTEAMAELLGLDPKKLAPFSIDLDAEFTPAAGLPQAGETVVRFKNDHLGYALTWFGLAATLAGVFLAYAATILWPRLAPK